MDLDTLIFDFGGTLDTDGVHWSEVYWEEMRRALPALDKREHSRAFVSASERVAGEVPYSGRGLRFTLGREVRHQLDILAARMPPDAAPETLAEGITDACYERVRATIATLRPLLSQLAERYELAVLSNFYGNLAVVLGELGIASLFRDSVDSVDVGVRKPDPAIFRLTLARLHAPAGRCAMVGDSYERDIVPAKTIGMRTVWLKGRSWHQPGDTTLADRTIASLSDLPAVLPLTGETLHRVSPRPPSGAPGE